MIDRDKEILEIKEAICEIYESIACDGFTPRFKEIVGKYRNEIELEADIRKERCN